MAVAELKEAIQLLRVNPVLWIPGIVAGILASSLWVLYNTTGAFFTSRLLIIVGLIYLFFITGLLVIVKNNGGGIRDLITGGAHNFFRVLLPQLAIIFFLGLVTIIAFITVSLAGGNPDPSIAAFLMLALGIPTMVMTSFFDTAAVFEERRVFDSIRRSIEIVAVRLNEVIAFLLVEAGIIAVTVFALMILWEAFLYDKLEPLTRFNETQIQAFTPDQMMAMIGPSGLWITAVVLFVAGLLLVPLLTSYKACFYRSLAGRAPVIQQETTGEYDSKGRWYKY